MRHSYLPCVEGLTLCYFIRYCGHLPLFVMSFLWVLILKFAWCWLWEGWSWQMSTCLQRSHRGFISWQRRGSDYPCSERPREELALGPHWRQSGFRFAVVACAFGEMEGVESFDVWWVLNLESSYAFWHSDTGIFIFLLPGGTDKVRIKKRANNNQKQKNKMEIKSETCT